MLALAQVLTECLAALGLIRGVPDAEFHQRVSTLRDQAEKAGLGFLSVEVHEAQCNVAPCSSPVSTHTKQSVICRACPRLKQPRVSSNALF